MLFLKPRYLEDGLLHDLPRFGLVSQRRGHFLTLRFFVGADSCIEGSTQGFGQAARRVLEGSNSECVGVQDIW